MVRGFVFAALAILLVPAATAAQGIDCSKARTPIEKAICASTELITLDRQIGAAYADALARQPDQTTSLRQDALRWLRARDAACNVAATQITRCLAGQMT